MNEILQHPFFSAHEIPRALPTSALRSDPFKNGSAGSSTTALRERERESNGHRDRASHRDSNSNANNGQGEVPPPPPSAPVAIMPPKSPGQRISTETAHYMVCMSYDDVIISIVTTQ